MNQLDEIKKYWNTEFSQLAETRIAFDDIRFLLSEIERKDEALRIYANRDYWENNHTFTVIANLISYRGKSIGGWSIAQQALNPVSEENKDGDKITK